MRAKTIQVGTTPWASPDGKVTIWDVEIEADGRKYPLKTMSPKIAVVGFEGDVETYTNEKGRVYVRQLPKASTGAEGGYKDHHQEIKTQWALGQAYSAATRLTVLTKNQEWEQVRYDAQKLLDLVEELTSQPPTEPNTTMGGEAIDNTSDIPF
jgi:hypothetical protein